MPPLLPPFAAHAATLLADSLVIGVTGHRHLRHGDLQHIEAAVRAWLQDLQARFPELPLVLLSSLAEGSDQLVTQVALDMGIRVIAPLPLPLELYRDDFIDTPGSIRLEQQLQHVEVIEMPLAAGSTRASVALPGAARDLQYAHAGIFVSRHCHVLLALWDGQAGPFGGTAHVVRFHLDGTMRDAVERQHAAATLLGPDSENVLYHLPVTRKEHETSADLEGRWLVDSEGTMPGAVLPGVFAQMFARQAAYYVDTRKYAAAINAQPLVSLAEASCPVWRSFIAADWLARLYQRRVARVLLGTYVLVALMGITFFTYTHVASQDVVIYGFLLLFLVGMGLTSVASRREWQRKYLDYRTLAEGLRVQSYWRRAGIVKPGAPEFAQDNFLQKQDVELGWIRNAMRGASLDGMLAPVAANAAEVEAVVREWIGTPRAEGQLAYYSASSLRRELRHRRNELLGLVCISLGVGLSVVLALGARLMGMELKHALVSVMGIVSVLAAVHEAYVHKKADKELIRQYRFMQRIFASAQRLLDAALELTERRRILVALGEAALTEHAEWTLMHRERPLPTSRI